MTTPALYDTQNSPFERMLRELPLHPLSVFLSDNASREMAPVQFSEVLFPGDPLSADIQETFPVLSHQHRGILGSRPGTPVTGKNIAVFFSGGPAAGGHNVIVGLKDILGDHNRLYGVTAGPKGLLAGDLFEITDVSGIRNTGGFDFLGSDRTKITTSEQFEKVRHWVSHYKLDGIVVVGGDDSNTNAAFLAEKLSDLKCTVVGVPKTIDGDLQVWPWVPISFGFDTATRIYAELVGNILKDTPSSRKYWHFIKLMGRSASHIALEVALQTQPTMTLISEEIAARAHSLDLIVTDMAKGVLRRAMLGHAYGVVLVPEGVIEFIPDVAGLIGELNEIMGDSEAQAVVVGARHAYVVGHLSADGKQAFLSLPEVIQTKLLMDRDAHGNLQVSQIPSELLFVESIAAKVHVIQANPGSFFSDLSDKELVALAQFSFAPLTHFFGYEGRCGAPSRFDAAYTYNLGLAAGSAVVQGLTGHMVGITDMATGGRAVALPLTGLIHAERRHGKTAYVIKKALVTLDSPAFQAFAAHRDAWALGDCFSSPGPRQYTGPLSQLMPLSVALNQGYASSVYQLGV
jgi:pyrophosphate--fructose-6-phosphate 1-phosphotransferase